MTRTAIDELEGSVNKQIVDLQTRVKKIEKARGRLNSRLERVEGLLEADDLDAETRAELEADADELRARIAAADNVLTGLEPALDGLLEAREMLTDWSPLEPAVEGLEESQSRLAEAGIDDGTVSLEDTPHLELDPGETVTDIEDIVTS